MDERRRLLTTAMRRHDELMAAASDGKGCDRHLLALRTLATRGGMPDDELFTDASWRAAGGDGTFTLSSSFVGYSTMYGGVVAMSHDGYGVFYRVAKRACVAAMPSNVMQHHVHHGRVEEQRD